MSDAQTRTTDAQSDLLLWIAAGAVAAVAIAWLVIWQLGAGGSEPQLAAAPTETVVPPVAAAAVPAPRSTSSAAAADSGPAALGDPLRAAKMAYEAGMLTEPENYSAWTLFGAALTADPGNEEALEGLAAVADVLLSRAGSAVEQGRYDDAKRVAEEVLAKLPEHAGAATVLETIADAEERQRIRERERAARAARAERSSSGAAGGASAESGARSRGEQSAEQALAALETEFEAAVAGNRLLAPDDDSAKHYLLEMRGIDESDARTAAAADWLITEMLSRARQATEATDWATAETWIDEAAALGADGAAVGEQKIFLTDRMAAAESAKRLPASELTIRRYVPPEYPRTAVSRGIEGWVDIDFRVTPTGETTDVSVSDASHSRLFQSEAVDAVSAWQFEPRMFEGRAIEQNAHTRVRFVFTD